MTTAVNCAEACINGCVLGDQCPHREHVAETSTFISNTSLDKMLEIAEAAVRKKMMARAADPPKWVFPEE
jgi:hypothetical protein